VKTILAAIGAVVVTILVAIILLYVYGFLRTVWYWRWGKGHRATNKAPNGRDVSVG
jgi:hypothetical protein